MKILLPHFKTLAFGSGGFTGGLSKALGLIMLLGFAYGVIKIIGGASQYGRDPDAAKSSIIGGLIIAGAVAIMHVLFSSFGLDVSNLFPDTGSF